MGVGMEEADEGSIGLFDGFGRGVGGNAELVVVVDVAVNLFSIGARIWHWG